MRQLRWFIEGVPSHYVEHLWPRIWPILERAVIRAPAEIRITREQALHRCLNEEAQLWVIWDAQEREFAAVAMTVISTAPDKDKPDLEIPFVAGRDMRRWLVPLWTTLRLFGMQNGCVNVLGYGRKGWERLLGFTHVGETAGGIRMMMRPLGLEN